MTPPTKVPLCLLPTPLHVLPRLSTELGVDLWIKRDDLTGFAMGGNKGRKLEYLIAAAISEGAEVVVTCGAAQSNFVRQLGAACAMHGLRCVAAIMDLPYEDEPAPGLRHGAGGNVLLDEILGIELHRFADGPWETLYDHAEALAVALEGDRKRVYRIPIGGSSPLGALAFYEAAREVGEGFDWIVTASSSGSTHTGLAYAFHGSETKVLGIASDPEPEIAEDFAELGVKLADLLDLPFRLAAAEYRMNFDFVGPGYGIPSGESDAAIAKLAKKEGIFLDPIYSGKAFAALLDAVSKGEIGGRILFWHTGGVPALFAHPS